MSQTTETLSLHDSMGPLEPPEPLEPIKPEESVSQSSYPPELEHIKILAQRSDWRPCIHACRRILYSPHEDPRDNDERTETRHKNAQPSHKDDSANGPAPPSRPHPLRNAFLNFYLGLAHDELARSMHLLSHAKIHAFDRAEAFFDDALAALPSPEAYVEYRWSQRPSYRGRARVAALHDPDDSDDSASPWDSAVPSPPSSFNGADADSCDSLLDIEAAAAQSPLARRLPPPLPPCLRIHPPAYTHRPTSPAPPVSPLRSDHIASRTPVVSPLTPTFRNRDPPPLHAETPSLPSPSPQLLRHIDAMRVQLHTLCEFVCEARQRAHEAQAAYAAAAPGGACRSSGYRVFGSLREHKAAEGVESSSRDSGRGTRMRGERVRVSIG